MIRKSIYFFIVSVSLIFFSCFPKKEKSVKKNLKSEFKNSVSTKKSFYIDVLINNDTLERERQSGIVKFFFKIDDTIKIAPKDERGVYLVLALVPKGDNKKKFKPSDKIKKELSFIPINSNDTIQIPFNITPHFSGKASIVGLIADTYTLHSYHKDDRVRMITYDEVFEKEFYIKEKKGN